MAEHERARHDDTELRLPALQKALGEGQAVVALMVANWEETQGCWRVSLLARGRHSHERERTVMVSEKQRMEQVLTAQLGAPPHHCAVALPARAASMKVLPVMMICMLSREKKTDPASSGEEVTDTQQVSVLGYPRQLDTEQDEDKPVLYI